jgi:hypothetical protein
MVSTGFSCPAHRALLDGQVDLGQRHDLDVEAHRFQRPAHHLVGEGAQLLALGVGRRGQHVARGHAAEARLPGGQEAEALGRRLGELGLQPLRFVVQLPALGIAVHQEGHHGQVQRRHVRRVAAGGRDREVDAAQRQLLDVLRVVAQLAAAEHIHLVAALGEFLHLLGEDLGRCLAGAGLLVGVAELQHRLRRGGQGDQERGGGQRGEREAAHVILHSGLS